MDSRLYDYQILDNHTAIQISFLLPSARRSRLSPHRPPPHVVVRAAPEKLKAKEAKNVGEVLEQWKTFRSLANANMASSGDAGAGEAQMGDAGGKDEARFSRLSVGLAVRQVTHFRQCRANALPTMLL